MGNEMGNSNSNVSGEQDQEKTYSEAANISAEAKVTAKNADSIAETLPVSSPKEEEMSKVLNSEDPPGIDDLHPEKEALEETDLDKSDAQASDGQERVPSESNVVNDEQTKSVSVSEDSCLPETTSASEKSLLGTRVDEVVSIQEEPESSSLEDPPQYSKDQLESNDVGDEEILLISLPEDGCFSETTLVSEKNQPGVSNKSQEQSSTDPETADTEVQVLEVLPKDSLVPNDTVDSVTHSALSEFGLNDGDTSDSARNAVRTIDEQDKNQTWNGREGEDSENPSLGTVAYPRGPESGESLDQTSNQPEPIKFHPELYLEDGCEMQKCNANVLGPNGPRNFEEENNFPDSNSEETNDNHLQKKEIESQEGKVTDFGNDDKTEVENDVDAEVGMTGKAHLSDIDVDATDAIQELTNLTTAPEPADLQASQTEFIVQYDQMELVENGFRIDHNETILSAGPDSEGPVEGLEMDKMRTSLLQFVQIGTSHDDNKKDTDANTLSFSVVETDTQTDDVKVTDSGNESEFHESAHNSGPEKNGMELEKQTKTAGDIFTSPTEIAAIEVVQEKVNDPGPETKQGEKQAEAVKATPFPSEPVEPEAISSPTYLVSLENMEKPNLESKQDNTGDTVHNSVTVHSSAGEKIDVSASSMNDQAIEIVQEKVNDPGPERKQGEKQAEAVKATPFPSEPVEPEAISSSTYLVSLENMEKANLESKQDNTGDTVHNSATVHSSAGEKIDVSASSMNDQAIEVVQEKVNDPGPERKQGEKQAEAVKATPFPSEPVEPEAISSPTYLVYLENMEKPNLESKQDNTGDTVVTKNFQFDSEASMQVETFCISTDHFQQQEPICVADDTKHGHHSSMELFGSQDSNESYKTAIEMENFSPMVENFQFHTPMAENTVPPIQNKSNDKRSNLSVSDQSPILYNDVFELHSSSSKRMASKVGAGAEKQDGETEFAKAGEGKSCKEPGEEETAEKQVITMERTDSHKSKVPLLSFLNEESYSAGSEQKQDRLVVTKGVEDKWNSPTDKHIATVPVGRRKRKPKSSFFSHCMCCTEVIQ